MNFDFRIELLQAYSELPLFREYTLNMDGLAIQIGSHMWEWYAQCKNTVLKHTILLDLAFLLWSVTYLCSARSDTNTNLCFIVTSSVRVRPMDRTS